MAGWAVEATQSLDGRLYWTTREKSELWLQSRSHITTPSQNASIASQDRGKTNRQASEPPWGSPPLHLPFSSFEHPLSVSPPSIKPDPGLWVCFPCMKVLRQVRLQFGCEHAAPFRQLLQTVWNSVAFRDCYPPSVGHFNVREGSERCDGRPSLCKVRQITSINDGWAFTSFATP